MWFNNKKFAILGVPIVLIALVALSIYVERGGITPNVKKEAPSSVGRLKIPSIGVNAAIEQVALTSDGAMDTPRGPQNVGWYSLGTRPGEEGSAVIGGHRGWKDGVLAVFDNLGDLQKGDTVNVVGDDGKIRTFVVRETRTYGKDEAPPEVFTSDGGAHLNLVTCVGDWDADLKSTSERLVVFTDLVS